MADYIDACPFLPRRVSRPDQRLRYSIRDLLQRVLGYAEYLYATVSNDDEYNEQRRGNDLDQVRTYYDDHGDEEVAGSEGPWIGAPDEPVAWIVTHAH